MANEKNGTVLHLASQSGARRAKAATRAAGENWPPAGAVDYYGRIENYAHKIRQTSDVGKIVALLEEALRETHALHTANEMAVVRKQVSAAERRIEQLKEELELVSQLVHEDQLTGALNRRGLEDALAREAARAERSGANFCVALIDIDNFKRINDTFGHQVGDIVLVHLVAIIRETIRTHDLIGRYGGEEFLLLLPDALIDEALRVMTRLQLSVARKPLSWGNQQLVVTFSAGVAARVAGEPDEVLIRRADQALYEAKRVGKDRVIVAP
jgi:diguanylate cyclase